MDFERLDTTSLALKLEEITKSNEFLRKENIALESYLHRHVSPEEAEEWADEDARRSRKGGKGGRGKGLPRVPGLTLDQKLDMATAELDAIKKEAAASEAQATQEVDALKAMLEQTELRIASLKKEAYEFKRDIVVGGENPRTGKTIAEKVLKYYVDIGKAKEALVDKLRLKNTFLKGQQGKLEMALRQKDEVGDALHYIDFHQLQIENKQYTARIEEKGTEVLRLKMSTGRTIQALNGMKMQLGEAGKATAKLKAEIKARSGLMERLHAEHAHLSAAIGKAHETGATLARVARESSDLPSVLDYIQLKALAATLARDASQWGRKLEIVELAAREAALKGFADPTALAAALAIGEPAAALLASVPGTTGVASPWATAGAAAAAAGKGATAGAVGSGTRGLGATTAARGHSAGAGGGSGVGASSASASRSAAAASASAPSYAPVMPPASSSSLSGATSTARASYGTGSRAGGGTGSGAVSVATSSATGTASMRSLPTGGRASGAAGSVTTGISHMSLGSTGSGGTGKPVAAPGGFGGTYAKGGGTLRLGAPPRTAATAAPPSLLSAATAAAASGGGSGSRVPGAGMPVAATGVRSTAAKPGAAPAARSRV